MNGRFGAFGVIGGEIKAMLSLIEKAVFIVVICCFAISGSGQVLAGASEVKVIRAHGLSDGEFLDAVEAVSCFYAVPVGVELVVRRGANGAPQSWAPGKKGLEADLDSLVATNPRYEWKAADGVVLIYPRSGDRDEEVNMLLSAKIDYFHLRSQSVFALRSQLARFESVESLLTSHGLKLENELIFENDFAPFPRRYVKEFKDATIRGIFSAIAVDGPVKIWIAGRKQGEPGTLELYFRQN